MIDEVRIRGIARPAGGLLFPGADSDQLDDAREQLHFGDLDETDTGDSDGDGTDNLTEYRLGLVPNSGSSRFAAKRTGGGSIRWPSVTGVTFTIERSATLAAGSWTTLEAAFPGTAGYTGPSPPTGKAFYKVTLHP